MRMKKERKADSRRKKERRNEGNGRKKKSDMLMVTTECISQALNKNGKTQAEALDISKLFNRVWNTGILQKLTHYDVSG